MVGTTGIAAQTDDAELVDLIAAGERSRNSFDAIQAEQMLVYVDRARAAGEEFAGRTAGRLEASAAAHELSLALTLPVATVECQLATARRVRSQLPAVWAAWHEGTISTRKISLIGRAVDQLTQQSSFGMLDVAVVKVATRKTPGQLWSWLDRFIESLETASATDRHRKANTHRSVWVTSAGDGMAYLTALISELSAAAIDSRLDAEARSLPATDPRTHEQSRADFLVDLLLTSASEDGEPQPTPTIANIGVIVPVQSLMGLSDAPGELADRSASVPAELIRTKAIEPGTLFWRLLTDKRGNLLDVTKLGRFAPEALGQAIRFRDGSSAFPTSTVPANRCDLDHTEAYPAPTTAANLGPLHRRAHNLKTAGLLSVRQSEPGVFDWITRTGHQYVYRADPLPVTAWEESAFPPEYITHVAAQSPPPEELHRAA